MDIFLFEVGAPPSINATDSDNRGLSAGDVFRFLKLYCTPFVIAFGLLTNVLAVYTYRSTKLVTFTPVTYLTSLAIVDSIFLLTLLLVWSALYDPRLLFSDWWCLVTTYFTEMTAFMSLWCVTALTLERYLQNCQPWILAKMRLHDVNMCGIFVVVAIVISGIVIYLNLSLMMGVVWIDNHPFCLRLPAFIDIKWVLSDLDIVFNFAMPYGIIIIFTSLSTRQCCRAHRLEKRSQQRGSFVLTTVITFRDEAASSYSSQTQPTAQCSSSLHHQPRSKFSAEIELTKLSIIIAVSFLAFNLPCHGLRIRALLLGRYQDDNSSFLSAQLIHWQQLMLYLLFCRPSFNFLLAFSSSDLFRKAFVLSFQKRNGRTHFEEQSDLPLELEPAGANAVPQALWQWKARKTVESQSPLSPFQSGSLQSHSPLRPFSMWDDLYSLCWCLMKSHEPCGQTMSSFFFALHQANSDHPLIYWRMASACSSSRCCFCNLENTFATSCTVVKFDLLNAWWCRWVSDCCQWYWWVSNKRS